MEDNVSDIENRCAGECCDVSAIDQKQREGKIAWRLHADILLQQMGVGGWGMGVRYRGKGHSLQEEGVGWLSLAAFIVTRHNPLSPIPYPLTHVPAAVDVDGLAGDVSIAGEHYSNPGDF